MKYKVGDKVRVRYDLKLNTRYYNENSDCFDVATILMIPFAGKIVTIKSVDDFEKYHICEDKYYFSWTDDMFNLSAKCFMR